MRRLGPSLALLLVVSQVHAAPTSAHYSIVSGADHRVIGDESCTIVGPRERTCSWSFVDRGLGPRLRSRFVIDGDGLPTLIENEGLDYDHNAVHERYLRRGGRAEWHGAAENEDRAVAGPVFYVSQPQLQAPDEQALLARALLRAPTRSLPLLPSGEARLERVGTIEVDNGRARKQVTQYEITGLELTPTRLWLDEQNEAFCTGNTILSGWESVGAALGKAEDVRINALRRRQMQDAAHTPKNGVAVVHARLFDSATARVRPNVTIVVQGAEVRAVGDDGAVAIPPGAEIVDATGQTLLPGLWDMHGHIGEVPALLALAGGVTTVRDMASSARAPRELFAQLEDGSAVGPHVLPVGLIDGPGPGQSHAELVHDVAEVRAAVDRDADAGFSQVKVYNSFKREWLPAFVAEAHRRHLRVSGHVPNDLKASDLVAAGFDELQHSYFVLLQFLREGDMMPLARFEVFADHAGELDLGAAPVRQLVADLQRHHVDVDLTLVSGERWLLARPGAVAPTYAAVADRLPAQLRRALSGGGLPADAGSDTRYRASFTTTLRLARALHEAGVAIAVGTDEELYGFSMHRELELLVAAGIAPAEVLGMATLGNARIMKREAKTGSIAPGMAADWLLVAGDPTQQIGDIRRTVLVCKSGVLYSPAAIYRSLGIRPPSR
jgi:Amidohydrolase family